MTCSISIFPSVKVPVLSKHRTSIRDKVSILNISWTKVFIFPNLTTLAAKDTLVNRTSPLGSIPSRAVAVLTIVLVIPWSRMI